MLCWTWERKIENFKWFPTKSYFGCWAGVSWKSFFLYKSLFHTSWYFGTFLSLFIINFEFILHLKKFALTYHLSFLSIASRRSVFIKKGKLCMENFWLPLFFISFCAWENSMTTEKKTFYQLRIIFRTFVLLRELFTFVTWTILSFLTSSTYFCFILNTHTKFPNPLIIWKS